MHERCASHYGDQNVERLPCMVVAADAIGLANANAFTAAHPAYRAAEALIAHLTDAERTRLQGAGHRLQPVIGRGLMVCHGGGHVRPAGELCKQGR